MRKLSGQQEKGKAMFEYLFICPGCGCYHGFRTSSWPMPADLTPEQNKWFQNKWTFNGNFEAPTLSPSVHLKDKDQNTICHSYVRNGKMEFLSDSKHELSGLTVDLPDWDGIQNFNYEK